MSQTKILTENRSIQAAIKNVRSRGQTIGLVPTMGSLHAGHLSLVEESNKRCEITVVTIFVNPLQFNEENDLRNYPRDLAADVSILDQLSVDYVFAPSPAELYPPGYSLSVDVGPLSKILEGRFRPGHFSGVATVLLKLFHLIPADTAFFGFKDYQQLKVVQQVVKDTNLPIKIVGCPTVREEDGLAKSSRNQLLSPTERQRAKCIYESLQEAQKMVDDGEYDAKRIMQSMRRHIHQATGKVDYVALVNPDTLTPENDLTKNTLALVAVRLGDVRLIDNRLIKVGNG